MVHFLTKGRNWGQKRPSSQSRTKDVEEGSPLRNFKVLQGCHCEDTIHRREV